jgi:hypothetical protein
MDQIPVKSSSFCVAAIIPTIKHVGALFGMQLYTRATTSCTAKRALHFCAVHLCNSLPNHSPHNCRSFYFWNSLAPTHVLEFDDNVLQVYVTHASTSPVPFLITTHSLTSPKNQKKKEAYLMHASQVQSIAQTSNFLSFIGKHTPHSSAHEFAEGYQFYN